MSRRRDLYGQVKTSIKTQKNKIFSYLIKYFTNVCSDHTKNILV